MTAPNRARATSDSTQRAGTFSTQWSDDQVLDLVAALARAVRPAAPHCASMAQCKNELIRRRRREPGLRTAPAPEAVRLRFNATPGTMTWAQILERALTPPAARTMQLAADSRVEPTEHLGKAHVAFALNRVARHLGATTVRRHEYAPAREAIIAGDGRRGGGGRLARLLPTKGQIDTICEGNWTAALRLAGLDVDRTAPARDRPRAALLPPGLPAAHAISVFVAVNGFKPAVHVLEQFAAASGFTLRDHRDWAAQLAEADRLLAERGIVVADHVNRRGGAGRRTKWTYPEGGVPGAPPRGAHALGPMVTRQVCEIAVRVWDLRLPARAKRNAASYQGWSAGTGWPSHNALIRNGGLSALRAAAQAANAEALRAGADRDELADALVEQAAALLDTPVYADPVANWDLDSAIAAVQQARKLPARSSAAASTAPTSKREVTLQHLVDARLLDQDETLISTYGGRRHEATFDEHGVITVYGLGDAQTLSDAAQLVVGSPRGGWKIWRVERDGELILLDAVREQFLAARVAQRETAVSHRQA